MNKKTILDDKKMERWFINFYPEMNNEIIATYLGVSESFVKSHAKQLGLKKSAEYMRSMQLHRIKKLKEHYASKKGDKDFFSYNQRERDASGKFIKKSKAAG